MSEATIYDLCSATQISLRRDRSLPAAGRVRGGAAILSGCLRTGLPARFRWIGESEGRHFYHVNELGEIAIDLELSTVEVVGSADLETELDMRRIEEDS